MAQEFNPAQDGSKSPPSPAQLDLLAALLSSENATYPWNPADPETEIYFEEQDALVSEVSSAEFQARSQHFYSKLTELWSAVTPSKKNSSSDIDCFPDWQHDFASYVPHAWLEAIADRAKQVFPAPNSLTEKLVQCVRGLLPNFVEADLLVLARPFAQTLCSVKQESQAVMSHLHHHDWDDLSEIEQAKASLAIARYALAQITVTETPHYNGHKHNEII
ncbi:hypothetical protein Glo7428_3401 [Gloeocapsa sp. PCC 7428]|uniref:hypothetical protein n=1 Tax=Gloeocapsa sp. PCC 7428 TaxID=1173026 RepID=UPI0002A5DEEB|nr:hypothetical protein [Gloeocapsa sp. PCC 7428]AFZ31880.1 hypothetical protein Glo7428_3401 [Gloeocapsa sp. PCC 7428]